MQTNPEIFNNNWQSLQKRYPDLAMKLALVKIGEDFELFAQEGCIPNVRYNRETYYIGKIDEYTEEEFNGLEIENAKVAVFLGLGLGYEVFYFLQKYAPINQTQHVIIIEKSLELFMAAMNVVDLSKIIEDTRIHFFIGIDKKDLYFTFREHYKQNIQQMLMCGATRPIFTHMAMKIDKKYYMFACQTLFESIYHSIQNFGNSPEDSLIGLENMLDNVNEIVNNPGINMLYDKFKNKPAIVVATGPSLKKNMHLLKGLKDKALILSVDSSFKLLMKNGIKPHMVTSLEREHEVQQFFDNFKEEEVKDVYMTACPVLFNHVYESYVGPKLIVYRNFDHFKWLEIDKGILDIKLSSANMAFKVAESLGCNPIILIGQDLAYGENDETHATEVPFSSEGEGIFFVPGNITEKIKTNSGWYNFLKAYELDIQKYTGTCINATEGGAYIQGTKIMTFKDAIKDFETFNPLDIIKENIKDFKNDSDSEFLRKKIEDTEQSISEIIRLCQKGSDLVNKYKDSDENIQEIKKKVFAPRLEIANGKHKTTFQLFLMHVIQSYHLKFEMEAIMTCKNDKEIIQKHIEWYSFIGDISQICLESLIKAKDKLYARV